MRFVEAGYLKLDDRFETVDDAIEAGMENLFKGQSIIDHASEWYEGPRVFVRANGEIGVHAYFDFSSGHGMNMHGLTKLKLPAARWLAWLLNTHHMFNGSCCWDRWMADFYTPGKIDPDNSEEWHEPESEEEARAFSKKGKDEYAAFRRDNPWLFYNGEEPPVSSEKAIALLPRKLRAPCAELLATKDGPIHEPLVCCFWQDGDWIHHCSDYIYHLICTGSFDMSDSFLFSLEATEPKELHRMLSEQSRAADAATNFLKVWK